MADHNQALAAIIAARREADCPALRQLHANALGLGYGGDAAALAEALGEYPPGHDREGQLRDPGDELETCIARVAKRCGIDLEGRTSKQLVEILGSNLLARAADLIRDAEARAKLETERAALAECTATRDRLERDLVDVGRERAILVDKLADAEIGLVARRAQAKLAEAEAKLASKSYRLGEIMIKLEAIDGGCWYFDRRTNGYGIWARDGYTYPIMPEADARRDGEYALAARARHPEIAKLVDERNAL